jgi:RimJ/RimL family protein N-acetyltransferase
MAIVETDRLLLRRFRESDLDAYADMLGDAEVTRYLGGKPMSRAEAWRHMAMVIGHWQLRGYGFWAVEERASGVMVGRVGCWYPEGWPGVEVGWTLRRAFWGRGFATEAARASLDYAFNELGQDHMISLIQPENAGSVRVAERLGERVEGETEIMGFRVLIYGIDRARWLAENRAAARPVKTQVALRPATLDDRRNVYEWMAASDVTASMMGPPIFSDAPVPTWEEFCADYVEYYFDGSREHDGRSFIIEVGGVAVGHVSYSGMDRERRVAELDIWLHSEAACGRGYGPAALELLARQLRERFGIRRFYMQPSRRNPRAIRAYERAGFRIIDAPEPTGIVRSRPDHFDAVFMVRGI